MSRPLSLISLFCAFVLFLATPSQRAFAQGFFLTPIPNSPFSGVVNIERTMVRNDGSVIQVKSIQNVARDSLGRVHNEMRTFVPILSSETPQLLRIHLYDPHTRISTNIDVPKRTFWTTTLNHPPATEPPSIRFAAPDGNAPANDFTQQEDLGIRDFEGVAAHGMRQTQIVAVSGGKEVQLVDEYWYSQDLRVNLMVKHVDPRKGTITMTVTQISRTEPDPTAFDVPEGYTQPGPHPAAQKAN
ncbi:MAG TPA: hypothetical protein VFA90_02810 [Terriglobales bacterium]|nr:hypothetical protein [Terriglobales bacterium]